MDFVKWAKQILFQWDRKGSGAGSLVAYVLSITELDPLKYGLIFERFLNQRGCLFLTLILIFALKEEMFLLIITKTSMVRSCCSNGTIGTMAAKGN